MDFIDLHTHSTASDGSMTPEELVRLAKAKGLRAIALTDHDTTDGLAAAVHEADKNGIELIPGIEISADFKTEMHILGYFISGNYSGITETLADFRKKREERNPRIINRLNEFGIEITMAEVIEKSRGSVTGRAHIAGVLIEKGYVESIEEAFDKYLGTGRPAYFKKDKLTPGQCFDEIRAASGIPVLAHPIYLGIGFNELDYLLGELKKAGLMGIEAYYVDNTREQTQELLELARKHALLVTGGSDFHGELKPDIQLGIGRGNLRVPYSLLNNLKRA